MLRVLFLVFGLQGTLLADFRAAVVKVDITPTAPQPLLGYQARTSTGVHDPLFHRVLVSTDIALVSPSLYDDFCRKLNTTLLFGVGTIRAMILYRTTSPKSPR